MQVRLAEGPFRADEELARFMDGLKGDGAVVSFTGLARPADAEGKAVTGLFLDSYPGMTEASLDEIAQDALRRFAVSAVRVVHRCGQIAPGEPIVFAAAAAPHRRAAFDAADYLMDRLKTDAALWKREEGAGGARWVEPTAGDRAARARWSG
jgi:molybdopterin synthase catalytic subunit